MGRIENKEDQMGLREGGFVYDFRMGEARWKPNRMESVRVTLAKILSNRGHGSRIGHLLLTRQPQVEGSGHQPSNETFNLQSCPAC